MRVIALISEDELRNYNIPKNAEIRIIVENGETFHLQTEADLQKSVLVSTCNHGGKIGFLADREIITGLDYKI